jgi:riboflavin biosynthesis pyrimidine reductase
MPPERSDSRQGRYGRTVRILLPSDDATAGRDPLDLYVSPVREATGRPWVAVNMVCTADGASVDPTGRSGALGGDADKKAFGALRSAADVIVAGSTTVKAEDYGPARVSPERQEARVARGQAPTPRIAVVTGSLNLDPGMRLFTSGGPRPLVLTTEASSPEARERLAPVADVIITGKDRVDWPLALGALAERAGARVVLVEGGPSVIGQLVADDLIDELCLTVAPLLAGGAAPRIAPGDPPPEMRHAQLAHLVEDEGFLLLRYVATRPAAA